MNVTNSKVGIKSNMRRMIYLIIGFTTFKGMDWLQSGDGFSRRHPLTNQCFAVSDLKSDYGLFSVISYQ